MSWLKVEACGPNLTEINGRTPFASPKTFDRRYGIYHAETSRRQEKINDGKVYL